MSIHPRPNPIIGALYTLRDIEVDVVVIHGPAGCGFMASRMIEEAGTRVVTTSVKDKDLIFGASELLVKCLKDVKERFNPKTVAVVGTCASMIIGEDMGAAIKRANIGCNVFPVDCHGCMNDNTAGAIKAIEGARGALLVPSEEADRQIVLFKEATKMERLVGMAGKDYLQPAKGPTKLKVAKRIREALENNKKVAVAVIAKKELIYRFADIFVAIDEARKKFGGKTLFIGNVDTQLGLPRIRRYASDVVSELDAKGIRMDHITGGLDEYALVGNRMEPILEEFDPDLLILVGIPHSYKKMKTSDILITDQPRQLANYIAQGYEYAVGEIATHSMVMSTRKIISLETGDTIREVCEL
jgi:putative methanogenesis marker 13 metalloprotein